MTGILGALLGSRGGGSSPIAVHLSNQSVFKASTSTSTASYTISNTKNVIGSPGGILEAWLTGSGANAANYEVMATATSGSTPTGTLGSWLNCGSSNGWSITNSAQDYSVISSAFTVQIRDVATHTIQASATITLSAESDAGGGGHL